MKNCSYYDVFPKGGMTTQGNELNDLSSYRNTLVKLAKSRSQIPIPNSSLVHANIALATIFDYANSLVCIYSQDLSGDILIKDNALYNSILSFLQKETSRLILSVVHSKSKHVQWDTIIKKHPLKIDLIYTPSDVVQKLNKIGIISFTVSDSYSIRIETKNDKETEETEEIEEIEETEETEETEQTNAFVCFFDPKSSKSLISLIDKPLVNDTNIR